MKKRIVLSESKINRIISNAVRKVLKEGKEYEFHNNYEIPEIVSDFIKDRGIIEDLNNDQPEDLYDYIWEQVDSAMIYYDDQWDLLKEYFVPSELNENSLSEAYENFVNDIVSAIEVVEEDDDEDDDNDEEEDIQ